MVLFDPRLAYILVMAVLIYWFIAVLFEKKVSLRLAYFFSIPFLIMLLLHSFWLLPLIVFRVNPITNLGAAYSSLASVKYFSFADFSHALTLLHPNWPDNIFGMVYFLRPEFLVIPTLAFLSLLFITKKNTKQNVVILSFALYGLSGAFLAKGANDPGGSLYLWLFSHLPGFNVFRDPAKFYLLTALSYSILIPLTLNFVLRFFSNNIRFRTIVILFFILFWLFSVRQAVFGELKGTFAVHTVPADYNKLKKFINQPEYFRTFWIPNTQRYGLNNYLHPALDAATALNTGSASAILNWVNSAYGIEELTRWSVKYVILPFDSQGEIFLDDRKYSEKVRSFYQTSLDTNTYLKKISIPGIDEKLTIYEVSNPRDHLRLDGNNPGAKMSWLMHFPTDYTVIISGLTKSAILVFSESYDPNWQIEINGKVIRSSATTDRLNSFRLSPDSNGIFKMEYTPQKYEQLGMIISLTSVILIIGIMIIV